MVHYRKGRKRQKTLKDGQEMGVTGTGRKLSSFPPTHTHSHPHLSEPFLSYSVGTLLVWMIKLYHPKGDKEYSSITKL